MVMLNIRALRNLCGGGSISARSIRGRPVPSLPTPLITTSGSSELHKSADVFQQRWFGHANSFVSFKDSSISLLYVYPIGF